MSPQVTAAWIAVSGVFLTVVVQIYSRLATSRDTKKTLKAQDEHLKTQFEEQREQQAQAFAEQREQLKTTLAAQSEQLGRTLAEQRIRTLNERFATAADRLGSDKPPPTQPNPARPPPGR